MGVRVIRFAELRIGDPLPPLVVEVTQEVIDRAALAHLDFNPVHTDIEWSARAQRFGTEKTVAHGMFTMSQMASVVQRAWGAGGAVIERMETKFTKPVTAGQTVRFEGEVRELHPHGPGRNFVLLAMNATDADGATVGVGSFRVRVPD